MFALRVGCSEGTRATDPTARDHIDRDRACESEVRTELFRVETSMKRKSGSKPTVEWGLGLEHETAPALADGSTPTYRALPPRIVSAVVDRNNFTTTRVAPSRPAASDGSKSNDASKAVAQSSDPPWTKPLTRTTIQMIKGDLVASSTVSNFISWSRRSQNAFFVSKEIVALAKKIGVTHASTMAILTFSTHCIVELHATGSGGGEPRSFDLRQAKALELALSSNAPAMLKEPRSRVREPTFEMDSGFVEFKSTKPVCATIQSIVAEVRSKETLLVSKLNREVARHNDRVAAFSNSPSIDREVKKKTAKAKKTTNEGNLLAPTTAWFGSSTPTRVSDLALNGRVQIMPNGGPLFPPGTAAEAEGTYAGSFHVWITLPHERGPSFDHVKFAREHARAMRAIQWLEPLAFACMPPDPRSPGCVSSSYSRASMRSRLNFLHGLGESTPLDTHAPVLVPCYPSEASFDNGDMPEVVSAESVMLTTKRGERIDLVQCVEQGRFKAGWSFTGQSMIATATNGEVESGGVDLRYLPCSTCASSQFFYVRVPGVEALEAIPTDRKLRKTRCDFSPSGFEVRIFDQMPHGCEDAILAFVVLASAAGCRSTRPIPLARDDEDWRRLIHRVGVYGSNCPVDRVFVKKLARVLGIPSPEAGSSRSAYTALNSIMASVYKAHGSSTACRSFKCDASVAWPDVNYPVWLASVRKMTESNPLLGRRINGVLDHPSFKDTGPDAESEMRKAAGAKLGRGWSDDIYMLRRMVSENDRA